MSVRGLDPARSRIILLGSPEYEDEKLPDVPHIAANLRDLAAVFTDPTIGGFPEECCITLPLRATGREIGRVLHRAAEQAEDLLLFYFAGHGNVLPRSRELYLALHDTDMDALGYSALRFETVRETFLDSPARNRVVILDSCFSGRAISTTLAADQQEALGQLGISGTYTLTSAPPNRLALVLPEETHTAFTGRLLTLLREGAPHAGPLVTMQDIYRHLRTRLRADGLPAPQQMGTENADQLGLVQNRTSAVRKPATGLLDGALAPGTPMSDLGSDGSRYQRNPAESLHVSERRFDILVKSREDQENESWEYDHHWSSWEAEESSRKEVKEYHIAELEEERLTRLQIEYLWCELTEEGDLERVKEIWENACEEHKNKR